MTFCSSSLIMEITLSIGAARAAVTANRTAFIVLIVGLRWPEFGILGQLE